MPDTRKDWLLLCALPGVGPRTLQRLIAHCGSPQQVLRASVAQLRSLGMRAQSCAQLDLYRRDPSSSPLHDTLAQTLSWLERPGQHLLTWDDPCYPPLLLEIPDPPPLLFVRGDVELLGSPQVAIVGSRHATRHGLQSARQFASQLLERGLIPTSGLALGIDGAAHQGALDSGGPTVAVLGTGVDRIYPARHRSLADRILDEGGALVSELPLGTAPRAQNFPRRNRILSGLSLGVLVIEAALKSGSLITARYALEQGREVFALPGSIHNPMSKGGHSLIRQGAKLVEVVDHLLEELPALISACRYPPALAERKEAFAAESGGASPAAQQALRNAGRSETALPLELGGALSSLLSLFGYEPVTVDWLVAQSGEPAAVVLSSLLELELLGAVRSVPGGFERA